MDVDAAAAMYELDATATAFGIELVDHGPTGAVTRMQVRADMCNGLGVIHGGMTFLLADSAMAFASNSDNDAAFATSAEIDWLAPARAGDWLTATAELLHAGGRSAIWSVTVESSAEPLGDRTTIAVFKGRTRKTGRTIVGTDDT